MKVWTILIAVRKFHILNDSLTSVTRTVTNTEDITSGFYVFIVFGNKLRAMFYQVYDGVDPENLNVVIDIKDQETGVFFNPVIYPNYIEVWMTNY